MQEVYQPVDSKSLKIILTFPAGSLLLLVTCWIFSFLLKFWKLKILLFIFKLIAFDVDAFRFILLITIYVTFKSLIKSHSFKSASKKAFKRFCK